MKDRICNLYDQIHMPDPCENQILAALEQRKIPGSKLPRIAAAAACLIALLMLLCNPTVAAALESTFTSVLEKIIEIQTAPGQDALTVVRYQSSEGKFSTEHKYRPDGSLIIGSGRNDLTKIPKWYVEQDDRVYFAGNGEWIDVTDHISLETPFTYIYTDQSGIIHYIAIGGVYDPDPEKWNVGYAEWYYDPDYVDPVHGIQGHWVGGYCDNYWNKDTDDDWPWLQKAKTDMGIPWQ